MNIVIKKNKLVSKLLLGGCIGGIIYLVNKVGNNSKKFKEHKEAALANYDIDKEIQEASINNQELSAENRADAKIILEHKKAKLEAATTIESFDLMLKNLKSTINGLKTIPSEDDKSSIQANLIYEKHKMDEEIRKKEIAAREQAELNKIKLVTGCIDNVMKMISPTLASTAGIVLNL